MQSHDGEFNARGFSMSRRRVLILGAAGRDFHDFNTVFRGDPKVEVVAFTATQIPKIEGRRYPAALAGPGYSHGIPIEPEDELERLIDEHAVDEAVFAYSDVSYGYVGHIAARVLAAGADFRLLGPRLTMLRSPVPVVAVTAVRTGCGKSPTTRYLVRALKESGRRIVVVRHPMPYGDLAKQAVQRFHSVADLDRHECTFEEREEYESHIDEGTIVYAGVDYGAILEQAAREADVILWDGGNNDLPFYTPDVWVTIADPLRAGHEAGYFPGEVNVRSANIVVINKVETADVDDVLAVERNVAKLNPSALVLRAKSVVTLAGDQAAVRGKRVLCIEDGPTLTHGGMEFGAGKVAAEQFGAREIVDPRPYAVRSIKATFEKYPHMGKLLPAMGYYPEQIADLEASVRATPCDVVLVGTPFDLGSKLRIDKPAIRVRYEMEDAQTEPHGPTLRDAVMERLLAHSSGGAR
jgi:predicted GTPase